MNNSTGTVYALESYIDKCNVITSNIEACIESNSSFKPILDEINSELDSASFNALPLALTLHFFNTALPSFIKIFMSLQ